MYTYRRIDSELKLAIALRDKLLLTEEDKILYKRYCNNNNLSEFNSISSKNILSKFLFPGNLSKNIDKYIIKIFISKWFLEIKIFIKNWKKNIIKNCNYIIHLWLKKLI